MAFHLIKVSDDLVEETQALQPLLVDVRLCVELLEVRDGGEHHAHQVIRLVVQVLQGARAEGCQTQRWPGETGGNTHLYTYASTMLRNSKQGPWFEVQCERFKKDLRERKLLNQKGITNIHVCYIRQTTSSNPTGLQHYLNVYAVIQPLKMCEFVVLMQ